MDNGMNEAQENSVQPIENIVEIDDGRLFTTSLIVAQMFEKEHKDVLKTISNLECSEQFAERNFALCNYSSNLAPDGRKYPYYRLTRDGFSILAMGFTGKKAMAWKEKFLEAFNAMERALVSRPVIKENPMIVPERNLRESWIKMLRGFASYWAYVDKMPLCVAEMILCRKMGVMRLDDILDSSTDWNLPPKALAYAMDICNRPTGEMRGKKASDYELELLKNILAACGEWKFTRHVNFEEKFKKLTGITPDQITDLSTHDAEKMLATAGCLLHQTYQYASDYLVFNEAIE